MTITIKPIFRSRSVKAIIFVSLLAMLFSAAGRSVFADEGSTIPDLCREEISAGRASWYVHPRYRQELMAASTVFPKGTRVKVTNLKNNKSVVVTIKDYGPDPIRHPDRVIDLNKVAFQKIANTRTGIINVTVEPVIAATSTVCQIAASTQVVTSTADQAVDYSSLTW
ncbi:MAG: septal ring lytic transglycosylase RlpA family protein [Patescibacteria group bacterium]